MKGSIQTLSVPEGYQVTIGGRQLLVPFVYPPNGYTYKVEQLICRRPDTHSLELRLRPWLRVYFSMAYALRGALLLGVGAILGLLVLWNRSAADDSYHRFLLPLLVACGFLAAAGWQLFESLCCLSDLGRVGVDFGTRTIKVGYRPWSGFRQQEPLSRVLAVDLVEYQTNGIPVAPFAVNPDPRGARWLVTLILDGEKPSAWGLTWSADGENARAAGRQLAAALGVPFLDQRSIPSVDGRLGKK
jgi:hypothetical protein